MAYRKLAISAVTASADDGTNRPANAIDGNPATRWSANGVGQFITADLGKEFKVQDVDILWHRGNVRRNNFRIRVSRDGQIFTEAYLGESTPNATMKEKYNTRDVQGRYVRVQVDGNNENTYASINEIEVFGDDMTEPTPTPPPVDTTKDFFGIKKIYPDAATPYEEHMDMVNARALPLDTFPDTFRKTANNVGLVGGVQVQSWEVSGDQVRLTLWTDDGKPWGNVEDTFYAKFRSGGTTLFQPYIGGGDHSNNNPARCDGNAYKIRVYANGDVAHRKEVCHEAYCSDQPRKVGAITNRLNNSVIARWYGYKIVQILLPNGAGTRIEVYLDDGCDNNGQLNIAGNENRWKKISSFDDLKTGQTAQGVPFGAWRCTDAEFADCMNCDTNTSSRLHPGFVRTKPYAVTRPSRSHNKADGTDLIHSNANAVVIRLDGTTTVMELAFWSAREITVPSVA